MSRQVAGTAPQKGQVALNQKIDSIPPLVKDPLSRQYLTTSPVPLGVGGFASVFRAKVIDRRAPPEASECALKVVRTQTLAKTSKQLRSRFRYELAIHNKLRHPNIVAFHRAFRFQDLTYVALELAENGSLSDVVRKRRYLTMPEIRRYMIQLCGAVDYLHAREIIHRDIKAGNVFLDADMNVKLGDFGLAAVLEPSPDDASLFHRRTTFCGTPNYLAPELLSRKTGHAAGVDLWAIGVLLYYLAVGRAPFHAKEKEDIYKRVMQNKYEWPVLQEGIDEIEIPQTLKDLVTDVLVEEEKRPGCRTIAEHDFFRTGFVPERMDPLARTRRPRWARGSNPLSRLGEDGTSTENEAYYKLLTSSFVKEGPIKRGRLLSVLVEAEREVAEGTVLEVPLREDFVYQRWTGGQRAKRKQMADAGPSICEDATATPPVPHASSSSKPPTTKEAPDTAATEPSTKSRNVATTAAIEPTSKSRNVVTTATTQPPLPKAPSPTYQQNRPTRAKTLRHIPQAMSCATAKLPATITSATVKARAAAINAANEGLDTGKRSDGKLTVIKRRHFDERPERGIRILGETSGNAISRPRSRVASRGEKKPFSWDV